MEILHYVGVYLKRKKTLFLHLQNHGFQPLLSVVKLLIVKGSISNEVFVALLLHMHPSPVPASNDGDWDRKRKLQE